MKQCPRCASEITANDKVCPRCGIPVDKMVFETETEEAETQVVYSSAEKREQKRLKKEAKKAEKKARKLKEQKSDTDFSKFASNSQNSSTTEAGKNKKSKKNTIQFEVDENGEFNIDTADVEIVGAETGKLIEERYKQTYSVKKARGDYRPERIKWWEIYKLADRAFARRKIKKEVSKAAKVKPDFIKKPKLLSLAIFFGWCGAHNFYAKNKKKGWTSIVSMSICLLIFLLAPTVPFFASIQLSIGGLTGFIVFYIWWGDIVNIIFNTFKYRIQKEQFIEHMNIETRAKLGEKYVDMDLYRSPWWNRLKVWWQKKKRNYQEWQHERRQAAIEREKVKQQRQAEQAKIDAEIAEFEAKENQQLSQSKADKIKEQLKRDNVLEEIKGFDGEVEEKQKKQKTAPKKARITVKTNKNNSNKNKKK